MIGLLTLPAGEQPESLFEVGATELFLLIIGGLLTIAVSVIFIVIIFRANREERSS